MKLKHLRPTFLVGLLLFSTLAFVVVPVKAAGENWLTGWTYRKNHVINSAPGAGTNYQVEITVHYGSGLDSAGDVYCNSHCQTGFGDIRWTDDTGKGLLDYWIEVSYASDNATFWVKISASLESSSQTIYLYYGNSTVSTTSNVTNTFVRVIDSNRPIDLALPIDEGTGTITYDKSGNGNNGVLTNSPSWVTGKYGNALSFLGSSSQYVINTSPTDLPVGASSPFTLNFWVYLPVAETDGAFFVGWGQPVGGQMRAIIQWNGNIYFWGSGDDVDSGVAFDVGSWQMITVTYDGTTVNIFKNTTNIYSGTWSGYNITTSTFWVAYPVNYIFEHFLTGTIDQVQIYNRALTSAEISDLYNNYGYVTPNLAGEALVRKRVDPEPVQSVWGTEETRIDSTPPTYSNISVSATVAGALCSFNCLVSDNVNVSSYIFGTNNTGTWTFDTATAFSNFYGNASAWANVTKTLNGTVGNIVSYLWYANDTSNNWSNSDQYNLTLTAYRPNLQMTPNSITCREYNETFSVQINVTNAIDMQAFNFTIYYDPSILNYSNVIWGELGNGTITEIDTVNGAVEGNVAGSPINGNCWLLKMTFQDLATIIWKQGQVNELNGQIWFHQAQLTFTDNSTLQYIEGGINQITVNQANYTFLPIQGDLNNDGTVNIRDIRTVAAYYDKTSADPEWPEASKYDLNNDNIIDISDIVLVAANFGFTYP